MAVIIDYDAGNLRSVQRACREVGLDAQITADPEALRRAERIIFPGVGAAASSKPVPARVGLAKHAPSVLRPLSAEHRRICHRSLIIVSCW